jgi:hypothetical protein
MQLAVYAATLVVMFGLMKLMAPPARNHAITAQVQ